MPKRKTKQVPRELRVGTEILMKKMQRHQIQKAEQLQTKEADTFRKVLDSFERKHYVEALNWFKSFDRVIAELNKMHGEIIARVGLLNVGLYSIAVRRYIVYKKTKQKQTQEAFKELIGIVKMSPESEKRVYEILKEHGEEKAIEKIKKKLQIK